MYLCEINQSDLFYLFIPCITVLRILSYLHNITYTKNVLNQYGSESGLHELGGSELGGLTCPGV